MSYELQLILYALQSIFANTLHAPPKQKRQFEYYCIESTLTDFYVRMCAFCFVSFFNIRCRSPPCLVCATPKYRPNTEVKFCGNITSALNSNSLLIPI